MALAAGQGQVEGLRAECSNLAAERSFYLSALKQKEACLAAAQQAVLEAFRVFLEEEDKVLMAQLRQARPATGAEAVDVVPMAVP